MNRLLLLAPGGTIAGCAENSATLNNYTAGGLGGDALLAAVPQLQQRLTRVMDLTAKHQARAAELTTRQHLQLRAQLLPAAEIISWNWIQEDHPIQPR